MTRLDGIAAAVVIAGSIVALAIPESLSRGGMIASTDVAEICATDGLPGSAYSRAHRVIRRPGRRGYERDHIVPLCLGGADTDANLQWQPIERALEKDRLERYTCRAVCRGHLSLAEAQSWFLGDWRDYMGKIR